IAFMTSNSGPECASWKPYTPPTSANRTTMPPMTGVSASARTRYPSTMPRAMNGIRPTSSSPPISSHWLEIGGLLLVGLIPFIALGIVLGYLVRADALTPVIGGIVVLFALVGGVYGFQLAHSGPLFDVMKAIPSYWLVQAGKTALGSGSWPAQGWIVIAAWTVALVAAASLAYRRSAARG